MEFEYKNKWHGISKVNINAGDKWEYLGITNKYLNSIFYKIDDNKRDENGHREVSQDELTILEKLFKIIADKTGCYRFFDEDFQEMEKQIDEGKIEGLPKRNPDETIENNEPQYKESVTHGGFNLTKQDLKDIENGKTDIETIRQKYIEKIKADLKQYHKYDDRFPEGKYEVDVVFNGKYFESFVYDTEFESFKKSDPKKLKLAVQEFDNGNFDAINTIENPVEFLEAYRKQSGGKTMLSTLMTSYQEGKISSDKIKEYMNTLEGKFEEYEREYKKAKQDNNFDNVNSFWYGSYFDLSLRVGEYFDQEKGMQRRYESNEINREQVHELQKFIKDNYNIEIKENIAARIMDETVMYDYHIYEYDFEELKNHYKNLDEERVKYSARWNIPYDGDDVDINEIKEIQKLFKDEYNKDISETDAASMIKDYRRPFEKGFNLEKLKQNFLNGKIFSNGNVKDFKEYLEVKVLGSGFIKNDTLETLEAKAQATEQEYGRYNFDIKKSPIADLARQSDRMRNRAEKEVHVTKTNNKIIMKNKATKEKRVIDLNMLTTSLDDAHKQALLEALNGFNNLSLWEFAKEATNSIGTFIHDEKHALAEYNVENDNININTKTEQKVDTYTLLHEMMHALMTTIIDGKNTQNEFLYKELVEAYNEEQNVHKEKGLRNGSYDGNNYTYCAQNLMEFVAEAGCLWLSGKSNSEYTIATHFPKSYRLFVQLIEKIRAQKTGRSMNEKAS